MFTGQEFIPTIDNDIFSIELIDIRFSKTPSNGHTGSRIVHDKASPDLTEGKFLFIILHL